MVKSSNYNHLQTLFAGQYDDVVQAASNTVHIKANKKIVFNVHYTETLKDVITTRKALLNRARIAFDMYGTRVEDLVGELYSPNYPEDYPNEADIRGW